VSDEWDFSNFVRILVEKALEHFQHHMEPREAIIID
jgi:hypothetical protein